MSALLIVGCIYCFVTVKNADQKCSEELHRARKLSRVQFQSAMEQLAIERKDLEKARSTIRELREKLEAQGHAVPDGPKVGASSLAATLSVAAPALAHAPVLAQGVIRTQPHMSLAALVIICASRADYLKRTLASVYENMGEYKPAVYISQDLDHASVTAVIEEYVKTKGAIHLRHPAPDLSDVPPREGKSYHAIARHYGWLLGQVFDEFHHPTAILLEEDMYVAPDFFEYFEATTPLLLNDPSVLCVSAWNDNGQSRNVHDPEALYRSDFFPGLGWMMSSALWAELKPKWPRGYWDDWLRLPKNRKDRVSIRPEISRSYTFGAQGSSHGQFYNKFLKPMVLNDRFVQFTKKDLSYLGNEKYDKWFQGIIAKAGEATIEEATSKQFIDTQTTDVRVKYADRDFKSVARRFGIMDDEKVGIRRASYGGTITLNNGKGRVFLVRSDI